MADHLGHIFVEVHAETKDYYLLHGVGIEPFVDEYGSNHISGVAGNYEKELNHRNSVLHWPLFNHISVPAILLHAYDTTVLMHSTIHIHMGP